MAQRKDDPPRPKERTGPSLEYNYRIREGKKNQKTHNPIPEGIDSHDRIAQQIASQNEYSRKKKLEVIVDYYIRVGLTRQQAVRRAERALGPIEQSGRTWRPIHSPVLVDLPTTTHEYYYDRLIPDDDTVREGSERKYGHAEIRDRQASFRRFVLRAYRTTCAVTGCKIEEVLNAAHIIPHSQDINYKIRNGICMRVDIHILFDKNMITIDEDYVTHVSRRIQEKEYRLLEGKPLHLPIEECDHPSRLYLRKRYQN